MVKFDKTRCIYDAENIEEVLRSYIMAAKRKGLTLILKGSIIVLSMAMLFACKQPDSTIPSVNDQEYFSVGADQNKYDTDENFTQEATGVEGTGTTSYVSSDESIAIVGLLTGEVDILAVGTTTITASNTGDASNNPASDSYILTVADSSFITTWETTIDGEWIIIPTTGAGYDYSVDWGDGNTDTGITGNGDHSYSSAGTYTVRITGTFPRIYFNNCGCRDKILTIENWGNLVWSSMGRAFYGCSNLEVNAVDSPNLSGVTDMSFMFRYTSDFNSDISGWDVSSVTNMSNMFHSVSTFNSDISSWDVSGVTDMSYMFHSASAFNSDISGWDVSSVTNMCLMFASASTFNSDISSWDVSDVTDMYGMFHSVSTFNSDISIWDVSGVTCMGYMFTDASAFNSDISGWDVSDVTDMSFMFMNASAFNSDISSWKVFGVTDMNYMFYHAAAFTNHDLSGWDVTGGPSHDNFSNDWGTGNTEPLWP